MVEEEKREDAVKAIAYEAMARVRDPVYGSAGIIFHLQEMVHELRSQLETTMAQVSELRAQRDQLQGIVVNAHVDPLFDAYNRTSQDDHQTIAYDPMMISFPNLDQMEPFNM